MFAASVRRAALCVALLACASACDAAGQSPPASRVVMEASHAEFEAPGLTRQRWRAANEQAESIAGSVTIAASDRAEDAVSFAFAHGVTLWARPALLPIEDDEVREMVRVAQEQIGAPAGAFPSFFEVMEERVALTAPQGGLCGGVRTRVIAVTEFLDGGGAEDSGLWALRIVAFHAPAGDPLRPVSLTLTQSSETGAGRPTRHRINPSNLRDCFSFDFIQSDAG